MILRTSSLRRITYESLPLIGSVFTCLFWFIDSAIDTFVFEHKRLYLENLLRPDTIELWMRFQVSFLIMSISLLAMIFMRRQHKINQQLKKYKRELEDIVFERTSDLSLKNTMLEKEIMERLKIEADLLHLATIDPLTSISNRRKFDEVLSYELKRDARYHNVMSLILCDLDNFKCINDNFGHNNGDEALKEFAQLVSDNIRKTDIFARWGGEEFALLLPETDLCTAVQMAEKLRRTIETHPMPEVGIITASFGVTQLMKYDDKTELINRADIALYKAKENGRNRVESFPPLQIPLRLFPVDEQEMISR